MSFCKIRCLYNIKMFLRAVRHFSYKPSTPLIFKDGKCELYNDKIGQSIYKGFAVSFTVAPVTVLLAVGSFSFSIFLNYFIVIFPLTLYHIIYRPINFGVKQLYLAEDGKSLIFTRFLKDDKVFTIKIKEIEFHS